MLNRVHTGTPPLERGSALRPPAELGELVEHIQAAVKECAGFIEAQVA